MIKCIVSHTIRQQVLERKIENYIKQHFPCAIITLITNEAYWKEPEYKKIVYNISNDWYITVAEFIKHLPLSWHQKKINGEEDAVWSKLCYPKEIFLTSEVVWVDIYTWKNDRIDQ